MSVVRWMVALALVGCGAAGGGPPTADESLGVAAEALAGGGTGAEVVTGADGAQVRATVLGDIKTYIAPDGSTLLLVVNVDSRSLLVWRPMGGVGWRAMDIVDLYNGLKVAGAAAVQAHDTHLTFVPGTRQVWLTASMHFGDESAKTKMLLRSSDGGRSWDRETFTTLDEGSLATHEGKMLCASEDSCVYVGIQDPSSGVGDGGSAYKVFRGTWCPAQAFPRAPAYFGQGSFVRAGGQLDLVGFSNVASTLTGVRVDAFRQRYRVDGCTLTPSAAPSTLERDVIALRPVNPTTNFPFVGSGLSSAPLVAPRTAGWLALADQATSRIVLEEMDPSGLVRAGPILTPPTGRLYNAPTMTYDATRDMFGVVYFSLAQQSDTIASYHLCSRSKVGAGGPWGEESCFLRDVPFKSVTRDPRKAAMGFFNNYLVAAAHDGLRAVAYVTDCTNQGDPSRETCGLRMWRSAAF